MARKSARTLWAAKLENRSVKGSGASAELTGIRKPYQGVILGVDPSLRGTGLAVVECIPGRKELLLHSETIKQKPKVPMSACLASISKAITRVLSDFPVTHVALEQTIYVQNFQTAQILGAARGSAIAAAALKGMPVFEYPPLRVKQAVVGFGRASKDQLARQVQNLLGHGRTLAQDEADAAGVALCHSLSYREGIESI